MATRHQAITKALNFAIIETGCSKNQAISLVIQTLVEAGISVKQATDAVLGEGTYQQIADATWEALQSKA